MLKLSTYQTKSNKNDVAKKKTTIENINDFTYKKTFDYTNEKGIYRINLKPHTVLLPRYDLLLHLDSFESDLYSVIDRWKHAKGKRKFTLCLVDFSDSGNTRESILTGYDIEVELKSIAITVTKNGYLLGFDNFYLVHQNDAPRTDE